MRAVFWISVAWLAYIYLGYPLVLWMLGLLRKLRPASNDEFTPSVSVLISARNEEKDIGWKAAETLGWNYPADQLEVLIASDASEDRTDEILKAVPDRRLRTIRNRQRTGKNPALNRLAEIAKGDVLFFTDANSHIPADCLRKMVRHFADPRVGCVTGWERAEGADAHAGMSEGGGAYLGYESMLNSLESRLGSVLVCDGSVFCIRRELFVQLQPDLANDLELPIRIGAKGCLLLYEPSGYSTEKNTSSPREEFSRRRRICGQGILGFWRLRSSFRGLRAWQFLSRKVMRWLAAIPMALALISTAALARQPFFGLLLILQAAFYSAALGGWYLVSRTARGSQILALPFYFMLVNFGAMTGIIDASRGRRYSVWEIPTLSRGREGAQ